MCLNYQVVYAALSNPRSSAAVAAVGYFQINRATISSVQTKRSPKGLIAAGLAIFILSIVSAIASWYYIHSWILVACSLYGGTVVGRRAVLLAFKRAQEEKGKARG